MYVIADIDGAIELLIGTTWNGILDLQNKKQWQVFANYIRRK